MGKGVAKKRTFPVPEKRHRFAKGNKLGGNKPAAITMKAREFILKCINGEEGMEKLVKRIYAQALKGGHRQQELIMNYILGRPVDNIKIDAVYGKMNLSSPPVVKIIADTIRLERLMKDVETAKAEGFSADRIKAMEDLLNKEVENGKQV